MDVSCVFNKKDKNYYEFKSEIKSKEQIGEFLKTDEKTIILQFEKWWDKYRVSIHELEAQVKKSEEDMWSYLKELNYE
jgi:type I restriction enzyme M protein